MHDVCETSVSRFPRQLTPGTLPLSKQDIHFKTQKPERESNLPPKSSQDLVRAALPPREENRGLQRHHQRL